MVANSQILKQKGTYAHSVRIIKTRSIRLSDQAEAASHNDINLSP